MLGVCQVLCHNMTDILKNTSCLKPLVLLYIIFFYDVMTNNNNIYVYNARAYIRKTEKICVIVSLCHRCSNSRRSHYDGFLKMCHKG